MRISARRALMAGVLLVVASTVLRSNTTLEAASWSATEEVRRTNYTSIHYVTTDQQNITLPAARSLLHQPSQFGEVDVCRLAPNLTTSPNTLVSAYFRVSSKHGTDQYDVWMKNFLGLQDHMVIFTNEDMFAKVQKFRAHALERTVIVLMNVEDLPLATLYPSAFWQDQLDRDYEKAMHKSYKLFWIWLSKSYWVHEAIKHNFFESDLFMWTDFGSFRGFSQRYWGKELLRHREVVPKDAIMQMAFQTPVPPAVTLFSDKLKYEKNFYHSGMHSVAYKSVWAQFYPAFLHTIDRFLERGLLLCDDQVVLQSCCLSYPDLCAYVLSREADDRRYRALRYVVHEGGNYHLWRYNPTNTRV